MLDNNGFPTLWYFEGLLLIRQTMPLCPSYGPAIYKKNYFPDLGVDLLYWPAQSSDFNSSQHSRADCALGLMLLGQNVSKWLKTGADIWKDFTLLYNYREKGFLSQFGLLFKLTILCNLQTEQSVWCQTMEINRKYQNSILPAECLNSNVKPDTWWPW